MELYAILELLQYLPLLLQLFESFFGDTGLSQYLPYLNYLPTIVETLNITQGETMDILNLLNITQGDSLELAGYANEILSNSNQQLINANAKSFHLIEMNLIHSAIMTIFISALTGLTVVGITINSLRRKG